MNELSQLIGVGIIVAIAVAWVIRRIVRRHRCARGGSSCGCGDAPDPCAGCDLASQCRSRRK